MHLLLKLVQYLILKVFYWQILLFPNPFVHRANWNEATAYFGGLYRFFLLGNSAHIWMSCYQFWHHWTKLAIVICLVIKVYQTFVLDFLKWGIIIQTNLSWFLFSQCLLSFVRLSVAVPRNLLEILDCSLWLYTSSMSCVISGYWWSWLCTTSCPL